MMSYAIKVKNPLPQHVGVEITEVRRMDGKDVTVIVGWGTILSGSTGSIPVDHEGDYGIRVAIHSSTGTGDEIGPASWKFLGHQDVDHPKEKPFSIKSSAEIRFQHWTNVISEKVPVDDCMRILAVELDPTAGEVEWRLKVTKIGEGRLGGTVTPLIGGITRLHLVVPVGRTVALQAKCTSKTWVEARARISGMRSILPEDNDQELKVRETPPPADEVSEEEPRSLAEIMERLRHQEVKV